MALPAAPWRIGVDVGGTFTDMVLADADGAQPDLQRFP